MYHVCILVVILFMDSLLIGCHAMNLSGRERTTQKGVPIETGPDACQHPSFLKRYSIAGYLGRQDAQRIVLTLNANLHQADCGTPDCFGTHLEVSMKVTSKLRQCLLQAVTIHRQHYNMCQGDDLFMSAQDLKPDVEPYLPQTTPIDLSDTRLKRLELRSRSGREALVLEPTNFFYFDDVTPQGILHMRLINDEDHWEDCCWGAISSELERLHYELQEQKKR